MPAKATAARAVQPQTVEGLFTLRRSQTTFWNAPNRVQYLVARRQFGKSYLLGGKAIQRMIRLPNHSCFFISASLRQGGENIRKEAIIWATVISKARIIADALKMRLETDADADANGRLLDVDAIADKMETALSIAASTGKLSAKRLEARLYHDRSTYSRSLVVPANPDTAVGYTGDTFLDELRSWQDYNAVMESLEPIISSNPAFISWGATTPAPDESHPSWGLLNPGDRIFTPNPAGNWYETNAEDEDAERYPILRVDAYDAESEAPFYSKKGGEIITVAEARRRATDRRAFDRNYLLKFLVGGSAAISAELLEAAMSSGLDCRFLNLGAIGEDAA